MTKINATETILNNLDNNALREAISRHGQEYARSSINYTLKQMGIKYTVRKGTMTAIMKRLGFRPEYSKRYLQHCAKKRKSPAA